MPVDSRITHVEDSDESALRGSSYRKSKRVSFSKTCNCQNSQRSSSKFRPCDCQYTCRRKPGNCPCFAEISEPATSRRSYTRDLAEPDRLTRRSSHRSSRRSSRNKKPKHRLSRFKDLDHVNGSPIAEDEEHEYFDREPSPPRSPRTPEDLYSDFEVDELPDQFDRLASEIHEAEERNDITPPSRRRPRSNAVSYATSPFFDMLQQDSDASRTWMEGERQQVRSAGPSPDMVAPGLMIYPRPQTTEWHRQQQRSKKRAGDV
ncbi:hypothetical protein TWF696_009140 [Orbilia brochopaga]|uniref:Zn(2)-C6 fungal-type domain-containing protein n=1 Tax=Orbilia brochopaga TaxID=3140254 RepID=A0AAV9UHV1_9PEZI